MKLATFRMRLCDCGLKCAGYEKGMVIKMKEPVIIRTAAETDAEELLAVYAPYVKETAITFEYEVPDIKEFRRRIADTTEKYPFLTADREGELIGYACASVFKERAAYDWSVETTVYVRRNEHGKGIGRLLYTALEEALRRQNILNANACIAYPNPESIAFHEKLGYRMAAHFTKCGYKFGRWYDMVWMEKLLGEHQDRPKKVVSIKEAE